MFFLIPGYLHEWRILCWQRALAVSWEREPETETERQRVVAIGMTSQTGRKEHSLGFLGNT